jgi:hypothetical protein
MCFTDDPAPSYLAVPKLPRIQQTLDGRAVNTKFRGDLIDGKVLFNRFRGLFFICYGVSISASFSELLAQSTCVQQARDILEGDFHR